MVTYWVVDGQTTKWQQTGHDGSAAQFPEWQSERHANSLVDLKAAMGSNPPASCLQCHSTDYRIAIADGKTAPSGAEANCGITCVVCHAPHPGAAQNTNKGAWDEGFDSQLIGDPSNPSDLCSTCHNSQIGDGVLTAGTTVYENQKEVMNGTGAIGVPQGLPGVHKGKCIRRMPPTSYSHGSAQLGGNHTFTVISPKDAVDVSPVPVSTTIVSTAFPTASPNTPVLTQNVDVASMPYSACSTCHSNNVMANSSPQPIATATTFATATPYPNVTATYITVNVTRQIQNTGDKGLWLQDTLDQRQAAMHAAYINVAAELHNGGLRMGFQHSANDADYNGWLNGVLNDKGSSVRTAAELNWQKAYADWTYVGAEGSWGIHNYQYDSLVI
ncbi:MAG TPA: multiheme c-type cytochrome [Thermoleophilia bacterium]|nr:multiheme c-type cytochrome [Thermoleophilia bacterium]